MNDVVHFVYVKESPDGWLTEYDDLSIKTSSAATRVHS
jgi:hypothetical protein